MGAKVGVGITLDPEVLAEARKRAEKENRPFSNYVETALRQQTNGQDMDEIAQQIFDLFQEKDFPEIIDIQKILRGE